MGRFGGAGNRQSFQSAFDKIKSGVITNLEHLDIVSFLQEAFSLFEEKIQTALDEERCHEGQRGTGCGVLDSEE